MPFFANNLHLQSSSSIANGYFDPKGFFPYNGEHGQVLYTLVTISLLLTPLWGGIVILFGGISLWRHWDGLNKRQRTVSSLTLLSILLLGAMIVSPLGQTIITWFLD